ncbi:MAG: small basic family protein [Peptococcaceae bacterium]|jgi:small basic protein|nr:small basic family protein [Peptococcaceae bacterium]NLM22085.1 small basic family protein [Peptococcaceae bacterium]
MWLPIFGLILGLIIGYLSPFTVPVEYAKYFSVAIIVALDSVMGGIRAYKEGNFDTTVFMSGFLVNILAACVLAFIGDRMGVDLYLAAIVAFGTRLFQNISIIRRHIINKR